MSSANHEILESRRVLIQTCASTSLQYAGFVVALALISLTAFPSVGKPGDYDLLGWGVEGVLLAGIVHASLNSALT
ncbi:MAG: hypothetical protein ABSB56_03605 [Nitrososphaerales archaeon]